MKTLRGSISESAKAEAPPKNPLRTPSLATRFWRGDGRARVARVALGVGLNKVNKKWESTQPTAAMVSHFWLEKSYVLNFFLSTFSLVRCGIAEEMRCAGWGELP